MSCANKLYQLARVEAKEGIIVGTYWGSSITPCQCNNLTMSMYYTIVLIVVARPDLSCARACLNLHYARFCNITKYCVLVAIRMGGLTIEIILHNGRPLQSGVHKGRRSVCLFRSDSKKQRQSIDLQNNVPWRPPLEYLRLQNSVMAWQTPGEW